MSMYICAKCKGSGHLNDGQIGMREEHHLCSWCFQELTPEEQQAYIPTKIIPPTKEQWNEIKKTYWGKS